MAKMTSFSRNTRIRLCHVCGFSEDEVDKLHYFPTKLERSKIWQENMGMIYAEETLQNHRICSRHFTAESYSNRFIWRLHPEAVPTLFPCTPPLLERQPELRAQVEVFTDLQPHIVEGDGNLDVIPPSPAPTPLDIPSTSGVVAQTKRSRSRSVFRGIDNMSKNTLTPRKKKLIKIVCSKEDHIRKLKRVCKEKAQNLRELCNLDESSVVRNLFKDLPTTTANFLISQLRCAKRDPKGRRWTTEEKVVALALMKRSPKCYRLLSKIVAMPSKKTLTTLLQRVPLNVGINEHLLAHINHSLEKKEDRVCVVLFDEVDIKENVQYNKSADRIMGFEDLGGHDGAKMANRALVFMCQGLARKWKQPVAYYFSTNGCSSAQLIKCLKEVLHAAKHIAGLDVVATICDMGTSNVKALKTLNSTLQNPFFEFEGEKVCTMFDPPHLLKCTASLFRKHAVALPITIGGKEETLEAKFSDIRQAYEIDKRTPLVFRGMPKIRDHHMAPMVRFAMKVSIAAQTLSRSVAAWLYTLLTRDEIEPRAIATATFVQQVDDLFDSFNSSSKEGPDGKPMKCSISDTSHHVDYWGKAYNMVKNWSYQRKTKKGNPMLNKPPSQYGWMVSIRAIQSIWETVKQKGLLFLRGRSLNQDGLENLFCLIRAGCGSSDNPTTVQFVGSLKTQILNGLTNQSLTGANCEPDDHDLLTNLISFIESEAAPSDLGVQPLGVAPLPSEPTNRDKLLDDLGDAVLMGNTCTLSVAYVSGFIARAILKNHTCELCRDALCSQPTDPHNAFIQYKEWTDDQQKLIYPSENFVILIGHSVSLLEQFVPVFKGRMNIAKHATDHLAAATDFSWFPCRTHIDFILQAVLRGVCQIGIPWWCKRYTESELKIKKDNREAKRKLKILQHK